MATVLIQAKVTILIIPLATAFLTFKPLATFHPAGRVGPQAGMADVIKGTQDMRAIGGLQCAY